MTNANSEVESYGYDSANRRTTITNGRSKTRTYAFTNRGEPYTLTLADSSVETWSYNGNGQVSAYTNPLTQTINYSFDDAGRQTLVDYPTGTDTSCSYDNADRRTAMVDSTGTTSWTFNDANEVTQLATPQGTMTYTYYDDGRRHTMVQTAGTTTYGYDYAGRMTSLANPYSETTSWAYDDANRVTRQTFSTGAYDAFGYDSRNRQTSVDHKNSPNSLISGESYVYDDAGNLTSATRGGTTTSYTFDAINQLLTESRTGYSASYTYDANGNRASKTLNSSTDTYTVDDADKLTSISDGGVTVKSYTYDAAGRTHTVVTGAGTTTMDYDYEGRITTITYPNSSTNTFSYNGLDTRVGKVDSGGTNTYKRDGPLVTAPVLSDGSAVYTSGISERRGSSSAFYGTDRLGTYSLETNSSQVTTATKQYDAFGMGVSSTGSSASPFGFAGSYGYQEDLDSELRLLGHHYYDASTGRFLTRDPSRQGRNWYSYCRNQPLRSTDRDGHGELGVLEFALKSGKKIVYWITDTWEEAVSLAEKLDPRGPIRVDPGHPVNRPEWGPNHLHNESVPGVHITDAGNADEAAGRGVPDWKNWRDLVKRVDAAEAVKSILYTLDPTMVHDVLGAGEEIGKQVVGPYVQEKQDARSKQLRWWLEE